LNPKFLEAIEMKQSLTGKEVTDVDNSSIRGFLRREMLMERVPATMPTAMNEPQGSEPEIPIDQEQMAEDALALAPTTAPAQPMDEDAVALAPTTAPTTAPSSQPTVVAAPTTQPTDVSEIPTDEVMPQPSSGD